MPSLLNRTDLKDRMIKYIKHKLKTYFLTGLLVVVPVGITLFILKFVIARLDDMLAVLPAAFHPQTYIPFPVPGLSLIIMLLIVMAVGIVTRNILGKKLVNMGEYIVDKIPLVRSVYLLVKQLMETIFNHDKTSFKQVIMVEYPRKGLYSLGFVTGVARGEVQEKTTQRVMNVFIPTSPNPTSGYLIMIPEEDIINLDMNVESAFKLILSGGVVTSEKQAEELLKKG